MITASPGLSRGGGMHVYAMLETESGSDVTLGGLPGMVRVWCFHKRTDFKIWPNRVSGVVQASLPAQEVPLPSDMTTSHSDSTGHVTPASHPGGFLQVKPRRRLGTLTTGAPSCRPQRRLQKRSGERLEFSPPPPEACPQRSGQLPAAKPTRGPGVLQLATEFQQFAKK